MHHALRLICKQGYENTSLQGILTAARVNPGSFHFLFRSKENLLIALLDHLGQQLEEQVFSPPFRPDTSPLDRIWERFRQAARLFRSFDPGGCPGCTVVLIAVNAGTKTRNPRVYRHAKAIFARWQQVIRAELADAIAAGQLPADVPLSKLARRLLAFYLGATILGRIESDRRVVRELLSPGSPLSPPA